MRDTSIAARVAVLFGQCSNERPDEVRGAAFVTRCDDGVLGGLPIGTDHAQPLASDP
jgi:hypothetical protein